MNKRVITSVVVFVFVVFRLQSQNTDSLFIIAQQSAYAKNYKNAENICRQLISLAPSRSDYKILLGRVFSWQQKTDSAKIVLKKVTDIETTNTDAFDALIDAELWAGNYKNAVANCNLILPQIKGTEKETILFKKAKSYYLMKDYSESKKILSELLFSNSSNKPAQDLLKDIKADEWKNYISVSYLNISFSNPSFHPWHFGYIEYQRRFSSCPILGRLNYGNVYKQSTYQLEIDAYPKFSKGTTAYLNIGYSTDNTIFPSFRAGAEIYQNLPKSFEVSGGIRYLHFNSTIDVYIYTAALGKYCKNMWFSYKPYLVIKGNNTFFSHTAIVRKYFSSQNNYISLNLIYGATPYTTTSIADISKVNSQRIGLDMQYKLKNDFLIKPMISYEYEEYFPGSFRNRFYSQLILTKLF